MAAEVTNPVRADPGEDFVRTSRDGDGVRMYGITSGHSGLKPAAVAGTVDWTLPPADVEGFWASDGAANLSVKSPSQARTLLGIDTDDDVTFGNVTVSSLTIIGGATIIATEITIRDPLIKLGSDNPSDLLDEGFYGKYVSGGTKFHGLFRDATDGKFKLFTGLTEEPTTTVNVAGVGYTYANLAIGDLSLTMSNDDKSGVSDYYKSRGTVIAPTEIVAGDYIHSQRFYGYGPSGYRQTADISVISDGTIDVNRVPSRIVFSTATDDVNNTLTERMSIGSTGFVGIGISTPVSKLCNTSTAIADSMTGNHSTDSSSFIWTVPTLDKYVAAFKNTHSAYGDGILIVGGGDKSTTRRLLRIENNDGTQVFMVDGSGAMQVGATGIASTLTATTLTLNAGSSITHNLGLQFSPYGIPNAVTFAQTTGFVGINKASSIGAQLHVVSSSPTVVTTILQGAVAQSVGHLQIIQGTGTITGNFISCTSSGGAEGNLLAITAEGYLDTGPIRQRKGAAPNRFDLAYLTANAFSLADDFRIRWGNSSNVTTTTFDTGLHRNAAGVVEVNNGTAGVYAALKCSTVHFMNGTVTRIPFLDSLGYNAIFSGNLTFNGTLLSTRSLAVSSANTTENAITITGPTSHSVPLLKINMGLTPSGNVFEVRTSLAVLTACITSAGEFSNDGGVSGSEKFGASAIVTGTTSVAFGASAQAAGTGSSSACGYNALATGNQSTAIGASSLASNTQCTAIGYGASATGVTSLAIGTSAQSGGRSIAIGIASTASATDAMAIGISTSATHQPSIVMGRGATSTAVGQLVIGADLCSITNVFIGKGVTNAVPVNVTYNATGGLGADIVGANLILAPGRSTGSAVPGSVIIQGTVAGASSSTAQTLVNVVTVTNGILKLTPGGTDALYINNSSGVLKYDFGFDGTGNSQVRMRDAVGNISILLSANVGVSSYVTAGLFGVNKTVPTAQLHVLQPATTTPVLILEGMTNSSVPMFKINMGLTPSGNVIDVFTSLAASVFSVSVAGVISGISMTLSSNALVTGDIRAGASKAYYWDTRSAIYSTADGIIEFLNAAGTDFNRLQLGGTTASFPAIKRSSATLAFRLADDSADCGITCSTVDGTKWGMAADQKQAWWGLAPVVQPTAVADAAGGANIDAECRTALNALLARQRTIGLLAT